MSEETTAGEANGGVVRERLLWQAATRDDVRVAQALHAGEEVDAIHELSEAGLLDGFFHFLELTGVREEIGALHLPGQERVLIPLVQMVVLYLLKVLLGIPSMNALPALLFSTVGLMTLVGFNAQQIAAGFSQRGDSRRRLTLQRQFRQFLETPFDVGLFDALVAVLGGGQPAQQVGLGPHPLG